VFYVDRKDIKYSSFGEHVAMLHVWIWGYADCQPRNLDNIRKLGADIEKLLSASATWAYWPDTDLGQFQYTFGGVDDWIGILSLEIMIEYRYAFGSP
jgi:hypothetical protein